mgnify:CR=1 FL=1
METTERRIEFLNLQKVNSLHGGEIESAISDILSSGWYILGKSLSRFERNYANYIGSDYCVGVGNGLDSLTLALRGCIELDLLSEGDEVLVPANTFIASVLAVIESGLTPVLIDVREDNFLIDLEHAERIVSDRSRAMMVVHLYGMCSFTDEIERFCHLHGLLVIEDNAQAHGCRYKEFRTGSIGIASGHSFYPVKNLGCVGDGGAVTTSTRELSDMIRQLSNYGFSKRYHADVQGVNSRLDELQAAVLDVKLQYLDTENQRRREIAKLYHSQLSDLESSGKIRLLHPEEEGLDCVWHIFPLFTERRDELQEHLRKDGVETLIHYPIPPHKQRGLKSLKSLSLPVSERLAQTELSLPMSPVMTDSDVDYVVESIKSFYN